MKRLPVNFKCFLIVLFSFWYLLFPVYLYFSIIDASDLAPSYPLFEKMNQEGSTAISDEKQKILKSTSFIIHALITQLPLALVPNPLCQLPVPDSKPLVLRC
jgi:hypothetical protein